LSWVVGDPEADLAVWREMSTANISRRYLRPWLSLAGAMAALVMAAGCGRDAGDRAAEAVSTITIVGDDRMRFSPTEFTVRRGATVTLVLKNVGTMPKESMGHNLVILTPGTDPHGFAAAALNHAATAYVPPEFQHRVVAATPVIGPGEEAELVFQVPGIAGTYPFVCSFPGHTPAGMRGVMQVR
jgi:azurin